MEQSHLHDGHILALKAALEMWRTLGQHGRLPDLHGGYVPCISGGTKSVKNIGTP